MPRLVKNPGPLLLAVPVGCPAEAAQEPNAAQADGFTLKAEAASPRAELDALKRLVAERIARQSVVRVDSR